MSRFVNLEFDGGLESEHRSGTGSVVKDEDYYLDRASDAFQQGRFAQALRFFARVLEFNPANVVAWSGQVRMLIELGEFPEARLWADKALERFPHDSDLLAAKAVALARLGDRQAALAFSDASMQERGDTPYVWLARGDVLLACKEKRAEYCFARATGLALNDWQVRWLASRIFRFYQKLATALKYAQEALALDGARAVVWLQLARCQWSLGLAAYATGSLARVVELDSSLPELAEARAEMSRQGLWTTLRSSWKRMFYRP